MQNLLEKFGLENRTPIQRRIEYNVTHGLFYNSQTNFIDGREFDFSDLDWQEIERYHLKEKSVKNSQEGLQAHLFEMEQRVKLPIIQVNRDYLQAKGKLTPWKRFRLRVAEYFLSDSEGLKDAAVYETINKIKERRGEGLLGDAIYYLFHAFGHKNSKAFDMAMLLHWK